MNEELRFSSFHHLLGLSGAIPHIEFSALAESLFDSFISK